MTRCFLVQTEKAFKQQEKGIYTIAFWGKNFKINKQELVKLLTTVKLSPTEITVSKSYNKTKRRGKKATKVIQYKPKKFFVKFPLAVKIDEAKIEEINLKLNPTPITK